MHIICYINLILIIAMKDIFMKMYEAADHLLIKTCDVTPGKHRHMAAHIIICLDDKMTVSVCGKDYQCYGALIPSDASHIVKSVNKPMLVFMYDCTSSISRQIKTLSFLTEHNCSKIVSAFKNFENHSTLESYTMFENLCLSECGINKTEQYICDDRINDSLTFINENLNEKISCPQVAQKVYLSPSRFSHLFKEKVGMSFSSYIIYQRLMSVYADIINGNSITNAALDAGFSDSAHFADVSRRVFGISASNITKRLTFIKLK